MKAIFLCDFDGTITEQDVYDQILDAFATGDWQSYGHAYDVNQITFRGYECGVREQPCLHPRKEVSLIL